VTKQQFNPPSQNHRLRFSLNLQSNTLPLSVAKNHSIADLTPPNSRYKAPKFARKISAK
jgi:hypothetical protein